jgi:aminoglycoside/choline kinase family phosphotransferase
MKLGRNLKKLRGDASTRIFFRKKKTNASSIIVYAYKDKKLNLLIYDAVNKILIKNDIIAPKLLSENFSKSYIEIQDFGNQTILSCIKKNNLNKLAILKKTINLLNKIQIIRQRKIKNFKKKNYQIPIYTPQILLDEAKLFTDWYIDKKIDKFKKLVFKKKFIKIVKKLIKKLHFKNDTFVHRDFHISNLMKVKNMIGVIDTQDALIGNKAYDVASLIDDVRFRTSINIKRRLLNYYLKSQKNLNRQYFKNDFEIISVLRNLKIIGIFTRLSARDKKKKYLKLIPYAWDLIKLRTKNNSKFKDLNDLLYDFTKKIK